MFLCWLSLKPLLQLLLAAERQVESDCSAGFCCKCNSEKDCIFCSVESWWLIKVALSCLLMLGIRCTQQLIWFSVLKVPVLCVVAAFIFLLAICVVDFFFVVVLLVVLSSAAFSVVIAFFVLCSFLVAVLFATVPVCIPWRTDVCVFEIELASVQFIFHCCYIHLLTGSVPDNLPVFCVNCYSVMSNGETVTVV